MGTNGKTIKEIAEEIGVSKQAVRNQIAKLGLQRSLRKIGNQFAIDNRQENLILQAFSEKIQTKLQSETQSDLRTNANQLCDILTAELAEKNAIIKSQQQTIDNLTEIVKTQADSIKADRHNQLAETLIDGKQLIDGRAEPLEQDIKLLKEHCMRTDEKIMQIKERLAEAKEQPEIKKRLFSRIFGN